MNVFEMLLKILSYHGICDKEANKRNEQLDSVLKGDGQQGWGDNDGKGSTCMPIR